MVILQKKVPGLSTAALTNFVLRARRAAGLRGTVNVLVTSSSAVRALNRQFRKQDKATDVLSFPATPTSFRSGKRVGLAGEIAVSADIALQNAVRLGHAAAQEIKILTLHGVLHLAGFDHARDNGEMARKELTLRQKLRLPAALIERVQPAQPKRLRATKRESLKHRRSTVNATRQRRTA